jgi:hypothetical protein
MHVNLRNSGHLLLLLLLLPEGEETYEYDDDCYRDGCGYEWSTAAYTQC